jgi:hypothetical protein
LAVNQGLIEPSAKKSAPGTFFKGNGIAFVGLAMVIAVTVLRDTRFFTQPRFWAEEGMLHFAFSFSHPWYQALFAPQVGYLNFWPNLATWLATLVPLEFAPLVTTLLAMLVQLIPVGLILWSRSSFWAGWPFKLAFVAVLLFTPLSSEVWLNTINSYNYLLIATLIILFEEPAQHSPRRWGTRGLLVIAGLSGTVSCFLIPIFIFRALLEKQRERWVQIIILSVCALIQIALILSYRSNADLSQRFHLIGLTTLGVVLWTQGLSLFATGFHQTRDWARMLFSMTTQDLAGFQLWGRLLLFAGMALILFLSANLSKKLRFLFLGSYAILLILMMMFSVISDKYTLLDTGLHQRIFFAPNVLLGWMMIMGIRFTREKGWLAFSGNLASAGCAFLVCASLIWGLINYHDPWFFNLNWPAWPAEVQAWRADPHYALRIQPDGWVVILDKK